MLLPQLAIQIPAGICFVPLRNVFIVSAEFVLCRQQNKFTAMISPRGT